MIFKPDSVSFYGTSLFSGNLPATNPPLTRVVSANVGSVPAVAVVNAVYNPYLCGYSITWASPTSSATPYDPVPRAEVEAILKSLDVGDFDDTSKEIPR